MCVCVCVCVCVWRRVCVCADERKIRDCARLKMDGGMQQQCIHYYETAKQVPLLMSLN